MNKNLKIGIVFLVVIVIAIILVNTISVHKTGNLVLKQNEIKIGVIEDLSGPLSDYGGWGLKGAKIAAEELRQKGYNVKLIVEDSKTKPEGAVNAINKLIMVDNVDFIVSGSGSSSISSMAPVANSNKKILFATLSSSPAISNAGKYVFRNRVTGSYEVKELADIISNKFNYHNVSFLASNNEAGNSYINSFKNFYKGLNYSSLLELGQTDYRTDILKLKSKNPDAVILVAPVKDSAYFLKQSKLLDLNAQFFSVSSIQNKSLFEIANNSANGLIYVTEAIHKDNPNYKNFEQKYKSEYGSDPGIYAINSYDAIEILAKTYKECGEERLRECLLEKKFSGAEGDFSFNENGDVSKSLVVKTIKNQEFVNYNN